MFDCQSDIKTDGFRSLREGEIVEFGLELTADGREKAVNVTGPGGSYVQVRRVIWSRPGGPATSVREGNQLCSDGRGPNPYGPIWAGSSPLWQPRGIVHSRRGSCARQLGFIRTCTRFSAPSDCGA